MSTATPEKLADNDVGDDDHYHGGKTEFFVGSHRKECRYDPGGKPSARFDGLAAGSAIVFDYRVLHRGLANRSGAARPLLYFTYGRAWFRDATNYPSLSLFEG